MTHKIFFVFAIALLSLTTLDAAEPRRSKRLRGEPVEYPAGLQHNIHPKKAPRHTAAAMVQLDATLPDTVYAQQVEKFLLDINVPVNMGVTLLDSCLQRLIINEIFRYSNPCFASYKSQALKYTILDKLDPEKHTVTTGPWDYPAYQALVLSLFANTCTVLRQSLLRKKLNCHVLALYPWEDTWQLEAVADAKWQRRINEYFTQDTLDDMLIDIADTFAKKIIQKIRH